MELTADKIAQMMICSKRCTKPIHSGTVFKNHCKEIFCTEVTKIGTLTAWRSK